MDGSRFVSLSLLQQESTIPASMRCQEKTPMSTLVTYSRSGPVSRIVMNDGKVNALSLGMLEALHSALDAAEQDQTVVILTGSGQTFSAGFDLKVFATGSAQDIYRMLKAGAEL